MKTKLLHSLFASLLALNTALAASTEHTVQTVAQRWENIEYGLPQDERAQAYQTLSERLNEQLENGDNNNPELLTWAGIVNASYAGAKGGLGALSLVKKARKQLERAIAIDENALLGGAKTTLGTLYAQVPGWPIGYGDKDKAKQLLEAASKSNRTNFTAQYFYGKFLLEQQNYPRARAVLSAAMDIPAREAHKRSDSARQAEISQRLSSMP